MLLQVAHLWFGSARTPPWRLGLHVGGKWAYTELRLYAKVRYTHEQRLWFVCPTQYSCKALGKVCWRNHTTKALEANLLQGDQAAAMSWLQGPLYCCVCETGLGLPVCPTAGCPRLHDSRRTMLCYRFASKLLWCTANRKACIVQVVLRGVAMPAVPSY